MIYKGNTASLSCVLDLVVNNDFFNLYLNEFNDDDSLSRPVTYTCSSFAQQLLNRLIQDPTLMGVIGMQALNCQWWLVHKRDSVPHAQFS